MKYHIIYILLMSNVIWADDIILKNGKVYKDVEIQGVDATGISIYYEGQQKVTTLNPDMLNSDTREKYKVFFDEYAQKREKLQIANNKQRAKNILLQNRIFFWGKIVQLINGGALAKIENPWEGIKNKYNTRSMEFVQSILPLFTPQEKQQYNILLNNEIDRLRGIIIENSERQKVEWRENYQARLSKNLPSDRVTTRTPPKNDYLPNSVQSEAAFNVILPLVDQKSSEWTRQHENNNFIKIENLPSGLIDGAEWQGFVYATGTYSYKSVTGASMTVACYTTSGKKALKYYEDIRLFNAAQKVTEEYKSTQSANNTSSSQ